MAKNYCFFALKNQPTFIKCREYVLTKKKKQVQNLFVNIYFISVTEWHHVIVLVNNNLICLHCSKQANLAKIAL